VSGWTSWIPDQDVRSQLVTDRGERIIDEVAHHWVAYVRPVIEALVAVVLLWAALWGPIELGAIFLVAALLVGLHAAYRALWEHMDRFVITNMRVYRVTGVFSRKVATTPMVRILDVTVTKPLIGRLLGYGHFVFESAAQEQGLREIRHVGHPDERDQTIQRALIDQGLRGRRQDVNRLHQD
jgi:uncharacterized membrane protein YdbT with pleckstrin-like domain